ncbi:MAG: glycosyltransferase family 2 protein [Acidimicrobiaceae bacterium]|nr:glycosyltransferase family 2 protein [Acidimicrobiaceae bacterium]
MSDVDLTLIVTAHDETLICGPTMESADIAVEAARAAGYTVRTIIALDRATEATTNYFQQPRFDHWERWPMEDGDLGRVRNNLVPRTSGRFIAFLDADDLFSENWLAEGLDTMTAADARGERVIAHPEVNIHFDGTKYLLQNVEQDSPLFAPHVLYVRNCYDSLCMAPREAHLEVPYVARDIPNGLSFQDWQFAVETMSRGWKHIVVPDTIIFKRRRDFSLNVESQYRKSIIRSLPEMAIDRVRDLARTSDRRSAPIQ